MKFIGIETIKKETKYVGYIQTKEIKTLFIFFIPIVTLGTEYNYTKYKE